MSVFGRFSVAIVTPFDQYIDQSTQRQNIDEKSLIKLVETVATGLNKAKLCLQEKGRDGNLIGG